MPGLDGRKMSKSYNNTIEIFDDPATITKKVKKIVTDSTPVEAPKNPDTCPLFNLFKLFASPGDLAEVERRYREGGIGYGEVKSRLAEAMIARFGRCARSGGPTGWRIPSASPWSARRRPSAPGQPPASCSTGRVPRAEWAERSARSSSGQASRPDAPQFRSFG